MISFKFLLKELITNFYKLDKSLFLRILTIGISLITIKFISYSETTYTKLIIKLMGLGVFISQFISTDYHRIFYLELVKENQSRNEFTGYIKQLKENYISNLTIHLLIFLPFVVFLLKPFDMVSFIFIYIYSINEKIFDETQRFLQCCNSSLNRYTNFMITRKLIILSFVFFSYFFSDFKNIIYMLFIGLPLSNLIAWLFINGVKKTLIDIKNLYKNIIHLQSFNKSSFFKISLFSQPIAFLSISSLSLVPYSLMESFNAYQLSNFAIIQKISSILLTLYNNIYFVKKRNIILNKLKSINFDKSKLFLKLNLHLYFLFLLLIIINTIFLIVGINPFVVFLSFLVYSFFIIQNLNLELILWKFSAIERSKYYIIPTIVNLLLVIDSELSNKIKLMIFILNYLSIFSLTSYLSKKKKIL